MMNAAERNYGGKRSSLIFGAIFRQTDLVLLEKSGTMDIYEQGCVGQLASSVANY